MQKRKQIMKSASLSSLLPEIEGLMDRSVAQYESLNPRMWRFIENYVDNRMSPAAAAQAAGYRNPKVAGINLLRIPKVLEEVKKRQQSFAATINVTRKQVVEGFMDAIAQAKLMAEPMTAIAGWREVGKMCGFYEPEQRNINISVNGELLMSKVNAMSDEELLRLAEQDLNTVEVQMSEVEELSEVEEAPLTPGSFENE